jgi:prepilin-type N-terminal cleavage/methylation domain-containing protein
MKRRGGGFTLIELLIAIALAAGVTVAATLLARSSLDYEARHVERWADRAGARDGRLLLQHYWSKRQKDKFLFTPRSLLLYFDDGGIRHFVAFACEGDATGISSLAFYRWPTDEQETARIQDGGAWPAAARQTLLAGLRTCGFSFLLPPAPDNPESVGLWVDKWVGRDRPAVLRLDLTGPRGPLPPLIVQAPTS